MRSARSTIVALVAVGVSIGMRGSAQTDFQWQGSLTTGQTLEVKGVNVDIRVLASSTTGAAVTATKSAYRSDPAGVRIDVVPHAGGVTICAVYPDVPGREPNRCDPGSNSRSQTRDNDTQVRFEVHVPVGV